jgi:LPS export ABC transporter permease LptF/LPS export ABC transporter permease LptG
MKRIHSVIKKETIPPAVIAMVVLTFIVFTREFGRLAELFIRKNVDPFTILKAIFYLLPGILLFTLPFAFLIGVLIGFARLSVDSEIIAMRAGGISTTQMLRPVLAGGLLVAVLTGVFSFWLLPAGNWNLRMLRTEINVAPVQTDIDSRVFYENYPGALLYIADIDLNRSVWKGVFLADSKDGEPRMILADEGKVMSSSGGRRIQLHFVNGSVYSRNNAEPEKDSISHFGTLDIPIAIQTGPVPHKVKRPIDKNTGDLFLDISGADPKMSHESLVELNRRMALPLAPIIFSFLGVALGIRTPRGGRGSGFIVSLAVSVAYFVLFATGSTLSKSGVLPIIIGVWGANFLLGSLALISFRYSNRITCIWIAILNRRFIVRISNWLRTVFRILSALVIRIMVRIRGWVWGAQSVRLRLARIIDAYMNRMFFINLGVSIAVLLSMVNLFTFFEIVDNVYENGSPISTVLTYFIFLQPQMIVLLAPIAILITTLITFGTLVRSNQIIAFNSVGISVFRIALPVLLSASAVCGFLFLAQEYVLPEANMQQDILRKTIQGRPVQTIQPGRHWIFGENNRLYNYRQFRSQRNSFAELSVYSLSIEGNGLQAQTYAESAQWDPRSRAWMLYNGWHRDYLKGSFETFETRKFAFLEKPAYFSEEVKESSKMTYSELNNYISDLQTGGFEVSHLQTELFKKVSVPIVSLIMVIIGVPFALTLGKRGALLGVAAGIFIGIAYWGALGFFDVLGANGLLAPELAAWGPNALFGSGGLILFSMMKT